MFDFQVSILIFFFQNRKSIDKTISELLQGKEENKTKVNKRPPAKPISLSYSMANNTYDNLQGLLALVMFIYM